MEQPDLITELEEARRRRDEGAEAASLGAHAWARMAGEQALADLARSGREFSSDDVHEAVGSPLGCGPGVIGSLFLMAARRGEIVHTGYVQSRRATSHGRVIKTWRGAA